MRSRSVAGSADSLGAAINAFILPEDGGVGAVLAGGWGLGVGLAKARVGRGKEMCPGMGLGSFGTAGFWRRERVRASQVGECDVRYRGGVSRCGSVGWKG